MSLIWNLRVLERELHNYKGIALGLEKAMGGGGDVDGGMKASRELVLEQIRSVEGKIELLKSIDEIKEHLGLVKSWMLGNKPKAKEQEQKYAQALDSIDKVLLFIKEI